MEIRKIYEYALQREHEGKRFFEQNADRLAHAAAAGAFQQLAAEEQKHIEFIQSQLDALDGKETAASSMGAELEAEGFFSQRAEAEMLDQTVIEAMVPDLPVLRMAYLIERDFAEFYEMVAGRSEGEVRRPGQRGTDHAGPLGAGARAALQTVARCCIRGVRSDALGRVAFSPMPAVDPRLMTRGERRSPAPILPSVNPFTRFPGRCRPSSYTVAGTPP